jgi:hypothetical protein
MGINLKATINVANSDKAQYTLCKESITTFTIFSRDPYVTFNDVQIGLIVNIDLLPKYT